MVPVRHSEVGGSLVAADQVPEEGQVKGSGVPVDDRQRFVVGAAAPGSVCQMRPASAWKRGSVRPAPARASLAHRHDGHRDPEDPVAEQVVFRVQAGHQLLRHTRLEALLPGAVAAVSHPEGVLEVFLVRKRLKRRDTPLSVRLDQSLDVSQELARVGTLVVGHDVSGDNRRPPWAPTGPCRTCETSPPMRMPSSFAFMPRMK